MRAKSMKPLDSSKPTYYMSYPTPESAHLWNLATFVDLFPLTKVFYGSNETQESVKGVDLVIGPQGLLFL